MDAKQFAWLYLVENGYANCRPSYYGGWDEVDPDDDTPWYARKRAVSLSAYGKDFDARQTNALKIVKEVGVDWNKTQAPRSDMVSQFTDTFHDPDEKEFLEGTLVLKNGKKQFWCGEALQVTNVFDMMAAVHEAPDRFKEVFGDK